MSPKIVSARPHEAYYFRRMGRPNLRYEGGRRPGIKGRVGYLRGSVIDANGGEVMRTRSSQLAGVIARALNGETVPRGSVEDPSPLARYTVSRGRRPSEYV